MTSTGWVTSLSTPSADHLSAPWCARSFKSIHTQRISVALHLASVEEILDTILQDGAAQAAAGAA